MSKFRLWKEKHYASGGYLYIKALNECVDGVVGKDIDLTLWERFEFCFVKGFQYLLLEKYKK